MYHTFVYVASMNFRSTRNSSRRHSGVSVSGMIVFQNADRIAVRRSSNRVSNRGIAGRFAFFEIGDRFRQDWHKPGSQLRIRKPKSVNIPTPRSTPKQATKVLHTPPHELLSRHLCACAGPMCSKHKKTRNRNMSHSVLFS